MNEVWKTKHKNISTLSNSMNLNYMPNELKVVNKSGVTERLGQEMGKQGRSGSKPFCITWLFNDLRVYTALVGMRQGWGGNNQASKFSVRNKLSTAF
jgi:hypothetical protein